MDDELHEMAANLHSVSIRMLRKLRHEDEGIGLSQPRLSALSVVVFAGPLSLAELAAAEQVKPPTMSRIVEALVEDRLVTRDAVPEDRRSVRIAATEKGRQLMKKGRERRVQALSERLVGLASSERRALARGIELLERIMRST